MPSTVAIIPARGGSRGIPGKNIRSMAGRPLIHWTLRAAVSCQRISRVFVSTDDAAIAAAAAEIPGVEILQRSPETATDTASSESVLMDAIARIGSFDDAVMIQATSPLLTAADLERGFAVRAAAGATSCLSVVRQKRFIWRDDGGGLGSAVNYEPLKRPRRQDYQGFLVENGAFYISSRSAILASGCRISGSIAFAEMDEAGYQELDEPHDWSLIEALLLARRPARAASVRLLACDVDGTLTDGGMYYGPQGEALKKFDTRDAFGLDRLRRVHGVEIGVISKEDSPTARARCAKLGITHQAHGCSDKVSVLKDWCARLGIGLEQVAYIGDDLNDLPALLVAGYAGVPSDAASACLKTADYVCERRGGRRAVREFTDHLFTRIEEGKSGGKHAHPSAPPSI